MNIQSLPLEFELAASQIAAQHYNAARYKLIPTISSNSIDIEFQGYFTEKFDPRNRPEPNPTDKFYRNEKIDFTLFYSYNRLSLSGWWRSAILSVEYTANNEYTWINEDGEEITRPYPDGDKFEIIMAQLYPLLQQYFTF